MESDVGSDRLTALIDTSANAFHLSASRGCTVCIMMNISSGKKKHLYIICAHKYNIYIHIHLCCTQAVVFSSLLRFNIVPVVPGIPEETEEWG